MWIKIIFIIVVIVGLCYLDIRNSFVYKYREEKKIDPNDTNIPSYARMLFSFKPLKDKYWIK